VRAGGSEPRTAGRRWGAPRRSGAYAHWPAGNADSEDDDTDDLTPTEELDAIVPNAGLDEVEDEPEAADDETVGRLELDTCEVDLRTNTVGGEKARHK
jgi:hypothetical protein